MLQKPLFDKSQKNKIFRNQQGELILVRIDTQTGFLYSLGKHLFDTQGLKGLRDLIDLALQEDDSNVVI